MTPITSPFITEMASTRHSFFRSLAAAKKDEVFQADLQTTAGQEDAGQVSPPA
jgi:hypothetical protein